MQRTRTFALVYGLVNALLGLLGLVPGVTTAPPAGAPPFPGDATYGYLFGLFPTNAMHNVEHLLVGLAGVAVYRSFDGSRVYAWVVTVLFALKALMGLFPETNTLFGMMPMFGNDVWLHAVLAIVAGYFAVAAQRERHAAGVGSAARRPVQA
jgi:hypothetical protein